jgi:hypothetical protein
MSEHSCRTFHAENFSLWGNDPFDAWVVREEREEEAQ